MSTSIEALSVAPKTKDDRRSAHALDTRTFLPSALMLLAQKIAASASAAYRPRFGVGLTDWRVLAALGAEPWIAPARIVEASGLDKAAVSRSLGVLRHAGLVEGEPGRRGGAHALTPQGLVLHDRMAAAAAERERRLLADFSAEDRVLFAEFVRRMGESADRM
jgi:DNA-binding MarR family transcriptional regulator